MTDPNPRGGPGAPTAPTSPSVRDIEQPVARDIELLTREEVRRLMGTCGTRSIKGVRDCALIAVLYGSGLRISEALALKPSDVDWGRGALTVRRGKGGKRRVVGIDRGNLALLERWTTARAGIVVSSGVVSSGVVSSGGFLFCGYRRGSEGLALDRRTAWRMLKQRAKRAGIDKRVHPHGLRHTHASELCVERTDLAVISKQLGHARVSTTDTYLKGLRGDAALGVISEREVW